MTDPSKKPKICAAGSTVEAERGEPIQVETADSVIQVVLVGPHPATGAFAFDLKTRSKFLDRIAAAIGQSDTQHDQRLDPRWPF